MYKPTKRKGFNFFRSYFDVYNELENDSDKVAFMDALLDRQFLGIRPTSLKGMAKFAYISQTNSIDSQVKGYEDKTGLILHPIEPPSVGVKTPPTEQVEEEVKLQGEVKVKVKEEVKLKETKKILLSEIKISDLEINEIQYFEIALAYQKLFIKNLKEKNAPASNQEKATYKNYVTPIRLMMCSDGVTKEQLTLVYKYLGSVEGEFWKSNILSTSKLREKFQQLLLKSQENGKSGNYKSGNTTPTTDELAEQSYSAVAKLLGRTQ